MPKNETNAQPQRGKGEASLLRLLKTESESPLLRSPFDCPEASLCTLGVEATKHERNVVAGSLVDALVEC
jgi:hypothetical protein